MNIENQIFTKGQDQHYLSIRKKVNKNKFA